MHCLVCTCFPFLVILAILERGLAATVALLELVASQAALLVDYLGLHGGKASVVFSATFALAFLAVFLAVVGVVTTVAPGTLALSWYKEPC